MPITINERVVAWLEYFQGPGRKSFQRYLERSGRYISIMRSILKEEGLPLDLVYIAMIESGFNSQAYSHASAVGFWQFIASTARIYDLKVGHWVDERRDVYKSTRAAARFFRDLYDKHGDWYVAMVGYNAGPGRINKAYKMTGVKDFWTWAAHKRALRAETRNYVPKYIAAAIIAKMPEKFGFTNINYAAPFDYDVSMVGTQTDLSVIADLTGSTNKNILILNPHLYRKITPPVRNYKVRLPKGTAAIFNQKYAKLPKSKRIRMAYHRVKRGDTLSGIARKYNVGVKTIARANHIRNYRHLKLGKKLIIPLNGKMPSSVASHGRSRTSKRQQAVYHRVKKGETAGHIARKYHVSLTNLQKWNKLNKRNTVRLGQKLKIYSSSRIATNTSSKAKSKIHILKSGDTLSGLAKKYHVTSADIMTWNNIKNPKRIRAGQKIKIRPQLSIAKNTANSKRNTSKSYKYTIKSGETLGGIANRHNVSIKQLMAWNNIRNAKSVRAGKSLRIYGEQVGRQGSGQRSSRSSVRMADNNISSSTISATKSYQYTVKPGETLGGIANRHNVSIKQLMVWNNIRHAKSVRAGKSLRIRGKQSSALELASVRDQLVADADKVEQNMYYQVRAGDTLWNIARKHNVSIAQLQKWNKLHDPSKVTPGTTLQITP